MSETSQQNEQLAKSISGFLDKYGNKLFSGVKTVYKKASDETRLNWRLGYENYLDKALNKYYYAKTFLSYNEPLPLYDLYVPLSVACGETFFEKTSIKDLMSANKFSIIMATGGSGKTMMMRHLFVDTILTKSVPQVPVFVELRELNDSELDLFGLIKKKLRDNKFNFGDDYIEKAFEAGHFILLLDGFDEVADAKRKDTIKQIEEIADKYEKNYIILSSRPDDSLHRWTLFNVWRVQSLTLDLACELVEKTEADEEIKEKFIKALKDELFEKHKSFLSNPLLLSIMLITYKNSANIPEKISTFYENAYFALFQQHDARKAYHREKRSKLDFLDFRKVFSSFCFFTYKDDLYNFSQAKAFEYLEKAQKYTGLTFEKNDFLHDCIQTVCLLLKDGLDITFSHRSFQEYFTAVFVSQINNRQVQQKFLESQISDWQILPCINLLIEMAPDTVEKNLIVPKMSELEDKIGYNGYLTTEIYKLLLKFLYIYIGISPPDPYEGETDWTISAAIKNTEFHQVLSIVSEFYLKSQKKELLNEHSNLFKVITKYMNQAYEVSIQTVINNDESFQAISKGTHWLSMDYYQEIFNIKKQLIEKHRKQEIFLEEVLFE